MPSCPICGESLVEGAAPRSAADCAAVPATGESLRCIVTSSRSKARASRTSTTSSYRDRPSPVNRSKQSSVPASSRAQSRCRPKADTPAESSAVCPDSRVARGWRSSVSSSSGSAETDSTSTTHRATRSRSSTTCTDARARPGLSAIRLSPVRAGRSDCRGRRWLSPMPLSKAAAPPPKTPRPRAARRKGCPPVACSGSERTSSLHPAYTLSKASFRKFRSFVSA